MTLSSISQEGTFTSLSKYQKQTLGLLTIGTFLEYFDLMLYIHMTLLLNEIFFPKTDHHTTILLSAFAFCSSYILRPVGAMLFGVIGDKLGRKSIIIITTFMMAVSCIIMANIRTYAQIGIMASWLVTMCRVMQGISSASEFVGAKLYLTETLKPPIRYPSVMLMSIGMAIGTIVALFMASFVISHGINWRYLFWFGSVIAIISLFARTKLQETTDFMEAKNKINQPNSISKNIVSQNVTFKTVVALFLLQCIWPISSYFSYIYCGDVLKNSFGFTAVQVINENLMISIANLIILIIISYYSYKIYPLKLAKFLLIPFVMTITIGPYLLMQYYTADNLFMLRLLIILFSPYAGLVMPISFMYVPVLKRFRYVSLSFAISTTIFYCVTPFSMVHLIDIFNYSGVTIIIFPLAICFLWAIMHFERLENRSVNDINYHEQPLLNL